ncbi:PQQ-binding-like beta-propeller repeat protein [Anaeromyxobacter terrae]|uniref:pyrrolo-quinoline quinone n=1 Tax=Anaeromyxobacter terrae TaxID=2925406 RepID=UPI001F57E197|nr:pyrrolo-quinoline quinone [Anaeromyxobacter sp. SG22]
MRHVVISAAALALACSSVEDRAACATSVECPAGQYCARTADGNVCWPDAVAPVVSSVSASCSTTPCLRDGVLRVEATVAEDEQVAGVEVALDLDAGARKVAMTLSGGRWLAELPLREWPFEAYARPVVASVVARDGARNEGGGAAAAVEVTRLRWERSLGSGQALTSAAVTDSGMILVANTAGELHFIASQGDPARDPIPVTGAQIVAAPTIGKDAIWIGSVDGTLYPVTPDGSQVGTGCATGERIASTPALLVNESRAAAGSQASIIVTATAAGSCNATTTDAPVMASPVVASTGEILSPSTSVFESFTPTTAGALRPNWSRPYPVVGDGVVAPPAVDADNGVWSVALDGSVHRTRPDGSTAKMTTVGSSASGIVILRDGSVVIGDLTGRVRRTAASGTAPWSDSGQLNGVPAAPMVVSGPSTQLIVPTSTGRLYAVRESDGSIAWSVKLSAAGAALQPANIYTTPGQPAGAVMSTAYVAGADGKLYAVIVDGQLDTAAPWPKAFHDPRNTNNAGTQP